LYVNIVSLEVIKQLIKKKEITKPRIVNIKGIFFKSEEINSESIIIKFSKDIIILFTKNGVPRPIIISFEKNPQKILPSDKTISGNAILIGAS
jgi:hypothetical protein